MSKEDISPSVLKKRFKGIENFLKRVAFNLGNTPSQTEVKIISCIPIDVTDLQQKIIHLEKQIEALEEAKDYSRSCVRSCCTPDLPQSSSAASKANKSVKIINKALKHSAHESILQGRYNEATAGNSLNCDPCKSPPCSVIKRKSNVSFVCPAVDLEATIRSKETNSDTSPRADRDVLSDIYNISTDPKMCEPKSNNQRQNFFRKKKKLLKNKKTYCPCVYYAHTNSSPFVDSDLIDDFPKYDRNDPMTRSYLTTMISKQYKPQLLRDNISVQSQFSSPICRDTVQPHCEENCPFESDICSCCYGPFHNIDKHVIKPNNLQTYMVHEINTGSAFYDTNQYDLVPVKEKAVKIKKDLEKPRNKEPRPHIDMKCWPEKVRMKYRYHSLYPLPTSSHCSARSRTDYSIRDKLDSYGRKIPVPPDRIEPIARILAKRRKEMYRRERSVNVDTSRCCSIDFGNVYSKRTYKSPKKPERLEPIKPMKNAECLTTVINNSECQTEMSTIEENSTASKTEATLTQIKSILQSVLAEVKVSSQTKAHIIENKPKKDAVVQKGSSRNNMQASSLMNSITYSPYVINPSSYVNSCSQQINPSQFCYSQGNGGLKCFHNFPVFIQHPGGRHFCSNCYRTSQVKPGYTKHATTIATNTEEVKDEHSKETEKLIKEIYKSMALTMDCTNKDTSLSEYDEIMKSLHDITPPIILKTEPKKQPKTIKNVVQAVSELFMKKEMMETTDTFNSTIESKSPSHEASVQSHMMTSTDTELRRRKNGLEQYLRSKIKHTVVPEIKKKTFRPAMVQDDNSVSESETSSSEADSETTVVSKVPKRALEQHKEVKENLLKKMFKSVKLFKSKERPKKRVEESQSEEEESTSDSDDYQTVYSQQIERNVRYRSRPHMQPRRKTHSKITYKQTYQRDRSPDKKKSPYMEQENRRYWDERLMFQDNRPQYSSERQYFEQSTPQKPPQKSAYYRTYEARSAIVEPKRIIPKNDQKINRGNGTQNKVNLKSTSKGMAWLKKHKMGIHCGEQWKKFIRES